MGAPVRSIPLLVVWFIAFATACTEADSQGQQVRVRPGAVKLPCNSDFRPEGFQVSEGEAIALAVGERRIACDRIDLEPMGGAVDPPVWAVHVDAKKPGGCEFGAEVDGDTGEVSNRYRNCE